MNDNLIIGEGGFEPWMSPLEKPRGTNQLSYKVLGQNEALYYYMF